MYLHTDRRFYIGARDLRLGNKAHEAPAKIGSRQEYLTTREEAIERAKQRMRDDPTLNEVNVVEIVHVIKRDTPPVVVYSVRDEPRSVTRESPHYGLDQS